MVHSKDTVGPSTNGENSPIIEYNNLINFGTKPSGFKLTSDIPIKNVSKKTIRITLEKKDCHCSTATNSLLIQHSETGNISLAINTFGMKQGEFRMKLIYNTSNILLPEFTITIAAIIGSPIISDQYSYVRNIKANQTIHKELVLIDPNWVFKSFEFSTNNKVEKNMKCKIIEDTICDLEIKAYTKTGKERIPYIIGLMNKFDKDLERIEGEILLYIDNPFFSTNEVFLGVISKSEDIKATKTFEVLQKQFEEKNIVLPDDFKVKYTNSGTTQSNHPFGDISFEYIIDQNTKLGLKKGEIVYYDDEEKYIIPISVLVIQ